MLVDLRRQVKAGGVDATAGASAHHRQGEREDPLVEGVPSMTDRIVQASLKLVLEPIVEADVEPCSSGFRPRRRAQDAVAEIQDDTTGNRGDEWVFEGDIAACFDDIDHTALMKRVRGRIADKRVLGLVRAFLKAGVLTEDGLNSDTRTGTPHGTGFSHHCWPASPCPCWMSTSPPGGKRSARHGPALSIDAPGARR